MPRTRRSVARLAVVMLVAGILLGALVPRLFASAGPGPRSQPHVHVVATGETIWGLAERFAPGQDARRFVYEVLELNDLRRPVLFPGQRLLLPAS